MTLAIMQFGAVLSAIMASLFLVGFLLSYIPYVLSAVALPFVLTFHAVVFIFNAIYKLVVFISNPIYKLVVFIFNKIYKLVVSLPSKIYELVVSLPSKIYELVVFVSIKTYADLKEVVGSILAVLLLSFMALSLVYMALSKLEII